jgi:hypothetical protein
MPGVLAWWRRLSLRNKGRIVVYPGLVACVAALVAFCTAMPGVSFRGPLPVATEAEKKLADELRADVVALAGAGERNTRTAGSLARSAAFVEGALTAAGYGVVRLPYSADGQEVANLEATLEGARKDEIVVVGAHYDSVLLSPGADDNASGVAAMLAIARRLRTGGAPRGRTIRFVAFVNEEPPHFWNETMGSLVYAKACRARGDRVVAMLSLETIGYFKDEPGSQKYPPVVGWLYPDRGDFLAFVGDTSSRALVRDSIAAFRASARFPSEGAALPSAVQGVGWSDQWSFWQAGYPGVMITDTAPFRNPSYHTGNDRPETFDYDRFARVTEGIVAVVEHLAR